MLQAEAGLPEVPRIPAPWSLHGHAWVVVMRLPRGAAGTTAFVPPQLRSSVRAPLAVLMCVEYLEAPCGPYRELLFIPGSMRFADGRRYPSISRILVSTWASVVNGRANWGIPKDRADFFFESGTGGDRIRVADAGHELCRLEFAAARGPHLPLATTWLPSRFSQLAQLHDAKTFYYQPSARGSFRLCRLRDWHFDPRLFPDLSKATVLACVRIGQFAMTFPVARVTNT